MAFNGKRSPIQNIRDHARHKHWKKLDSIVRTLVAMDASPTDLEERLRSVLGRTMDQEGKNGLGDPDSAFAEADTDTVVKGRATSKEGGHDRMIKVEDDEEQPRSATRYDGTHVGNSPALGMDRQKRKATEDIATMDRKGKRLTRSKNGNQPPSEQTGHFGLKLSQRSFSEAPPDATKAPTPAAHIYRNDRGGVKIRPTVGWQFRQIKGIKKVWYDGKWLDRRMRLCSREGGGSFKEGSSSIPEVSVLKVGMITCMFWPTLHVAPKTPSPITRDFTIRRGMRFFRVGQPSLGMRQVDA